MKICFCIGSYPFFEDEIGNIFVKNLVHALTDIGVECTVVSPQSITNVFFRRNKQHPVEWIDKTIKGNEIRVLQPYYTSFSNVKIRGNSVSALVRLAVVRKAFKKYKIEADCMYGHFWGEGITASIVGKENGIPSVVACGESEIWVDKQFDDSFIERALENIRGVISVSSKNVGTCETKGLLKNNPEVIVLPNCVDSTKFYKKDKLKARSEKNIPPDVTIAAFVGAFSDRKGVERVIKASREVDGLKLILIGEGKSIKPADNILFCGLVPNSEIVDYLNAADFFVLPTLAEGCCNAIIEAMACGLPIISSNYSFNDDVLNEINSIRIDPLDIKEISEAMQLLMSNTELRDELSHNALKDSRELVIEKRAERIVRFICALL